MLYPVELMAEDKLCGHFQAGVRALAARPRAVLAMIVVVPCALFGAGFADIRAKAAQFLGIIAFHGHKLRRQATNGRALHIYLNTMLHHFDVVFTQTSGGADIARRGAFITLFDTFTIVLLHKSLLILPRGVDKSAQKWRVSQTANHFFILFEQNC